MCISVVSAGVVPEYSVVRYYMHGDTPRVGYILHGETNVILVDPLGGSRITILDAEDFVELLATPAATACSYIGGLE
jgi:hypothetical protein